MKGIRYQSLCSGKWHHLIQTLMKPTLYHEEVSHYFGFTWAISFTKNTFPWDLVNIYSSFKIQLRGLPSWSSGQESAFQCRTGRFDAWSRQLSPSTTTSEPMCSRAWMLQPRAHAPQQRPSTAKTSGTTQVCLWSLLRPTLLEVCSHFWSVPLWNPWTCSTVVNMVV